jgi:CopG family nickel-responsive transcriptional regulator
MHRFTISLDDDLAQQFERLIVQRGYANRSEAVRDLIRERLGAALLDPVSTPWCAATVTYVYDHHERTMTARLTALQHEHHDLVVSCTHIHLDHDHCLETVVLRGPTQAVQACAGRMIALRGVRHGQVHLLALAEEARPHRHEPDAPAPHRHLRPVN